MTKKRITAALRRPMTKKEWENLGKKMAAVCQAKLATQEEKSRVTKELNGQIAEHDSEIQQIAYEMDRGTVPEDVDCYLHYDDPEPGKKTLVRIDNGEKVWTKDFDDEDFQRSFEEWDGKTVGEEGAH